MKHIIWTSDINFEDWRDDLKSEYPDYSNEELDNLASELNNDYYFDERANLNKELGSPIIMIADVGLWTGRREGYKILNSTNLNACLTGSCGDFVTWYVEGDEVKCEDIHHDGTNYYTYRVLKNISPREFEELAFENFRKALEKTEPLGHYVCEIYGWREDND